MYESKVFSMNDFENTDRNEAIVNRTDLLYEWQIKTYFWKSHIMIYGNNQTMGFEAN